MNLNRLQNSSGTFRKVFQVFPAAISFSFLSGIFLLYQIIEGGEKTGTSIVLDVLIFSLTGTPLFFAVGAYCVLKQLDVRQKLILNGLAVIFILLLYLAIPMTDAPYALERHFFQWMALIFAFHLLLSLVPFIVDRRNPFFFWQYNQMVFKRLIISQFFTFVIISGLFLLLLTIQFLFDVIVSYKLYLSIFTVAVYMFHSVFFAAGIPLSRIKSEGIHPKPGLLGSFIQFIALPLLFVYLSILLWYGAQIAITGVWPKGMIVFLIAIAAVFGLLIFLLLYPFGKLETIIKIELAEKIFYIALLPLLVLYFTAIEKRVGEYGITESRYLAIVLGIWLCLLSVKAFIAKSNLMFIPLSLFLGVIFISFGPWSMYSVSKRAQLARLERILTEECLLENGKIVSEVIWRQDSLPSLVAEKGRIDYVRLSEQKQKQITNITHYLIATHGYETIQAWFSQDMTTLADLKSRQGEEPSYVLTELFLQTMGFDYKAFVDDEYGYVE